MSIHEIEVEFTKVIDQILVYHRECCIDMHIQSDVRVRDEMYIKAEAARVITMLLAKELLTKKDAVQFKEAMRVRLGAVHQSIFFDPATRKLIKSTKEQRNGG